jgi:hypothetical protein
MATKSKTCSKPTRSYAKPAGTGLVTPGNGKRSGTIKPLVKQIALDTPRKAPK